MQYSSSETTDGERDMMALIRATRDNDLDGIDAIVSGAGEHGLMFIATGLAAALNEVLIRYAAARLALGDLDADAATIIATADTSQLADFPPLSGILDEVITSMQHRVINGDLDEG
jgi:hypothetical protein